MKHAISMGLLLAMTVAVASGAAKGPKSSARAALRDAQGKAVGTASLRQVKTGVQISLRLSGLPAGTHAFHIHNVGKCDPPDFQSAGPHFNPEAKKHGLKNPEGPHAGDMPNVAVAANGKGSARVVNTRITLGSGSNSVFHDGGTALVVHEKADDEMTDPAGNAGARIACGVIEKTP